MVTLISLSPSLRSMTQRTEAESVVSSSSETLPPYLPLTSPDHKPPLTLTESTTNHTPSVSSENLPHLSLSLLPFSNSLPLPSTRSSLHLKTEGHLASQDDHMTSLSSHMTLRKRETQCVVPTATLSLNIPQDSERLVRSKIRRQVVVANGNCSPPAGVKRLTTHLPATGLEPVLESSVMSPPSRNLRFRPYTGKT